MSDQIDTPNPEYAAMAGAWKLIDALMGGTMAMKEAGTTYLPKEEKEEESCYNVRLERSVLFERFPAAVDSLSGRPFAQPVQLRGDKLPERLAKIPAAVDDEGRDLTGFCKHLLEIGLKRGLVHILVDYPPVTARNLAEERDLDLRPLLLAIDPKDLIGWKYHIAVNGAKRLTQIRIAETASVPKPDNQYEVEIRRRVRVINGPVPATEDQPGQEAGWELWESVQGEKGEAWEKIDSGPWTVGQITLVTIYFRKAGFLTGKSPLEGLAWLNLAHWQAMSDYLNNARFACARIYFRKGMTEKELEKPIVVGVNQEFGCSSPNADLRIIESSGATLAAAKTVLDQLEQQMDAVAKGPLIVRPSGNLTATGQAIDEGKGQCELQAWVRQIEAGLRQAFVFAAEWVGEKLPDDFGVDIYDDFGILLRSDTDLNHLEQARQRGDIDRQTYLEGFKLRGLLPENTNIETILERVRQDGPALGMIGRESNEET